MCAYLLRHVSTSNDRDLILCSNSTLREPCYIFWRHFFRFFWMHRWDKYTPDWLDPLQWWQGENVCLDSGTSRSRFPRHVSCQPHVPRSRCSHFWNCIVFDIVATVALQCVQQQIGFNVSCLCERHSRKDHVWQDTMEALTSGFIAHVVLNHAFLVYFSRATDTIPSPLRTQLRRWCLTIHDFRRRLWFASSFDSDSKDICHVSLTSNFLLSPISTGFNIVFDDTIRSFWTCFWTDRLDQTAWPGRQPNHQRNAQTERSVSFRKPHYQPIWSDWSVPSPIPLTPTAPQNHNNLLWIGPTTCCIFCFCGQWDTRPAILICVATA